MTYVVILLVMLLSFTIVGWPLLRASRTTKRDSGEASPLDDLIGQRDAAYRGIRELDFEYEIGNLSDSDYNELRQRYRSDAAAILQKLDAAMAAEAETPPALVPSSNGDTADPVSAPGAHCSKCGETVDAEDQFCWSCGTEMVRRCSNCSSIVPADRRYCPGCGVQTERT